MRNRATVPALISGATLLAGLVLGRQWGVRQCWWGEATCPGILWGGKALPARPDPDGWLEERAQELAQRKIEITVRGLPEVRQTLTLSELGASLDVVRSARLVHAVGHTGPWVERIASAQRATKGGIDLPPLVNIDQGAAFHALGSLKEAADQPAIPARLDWAHGGIMPEIPGHYLDFDAALEQVRRAAVDGSSRIELDRVEVIPHVSSAYLRQIDVHAELARFQTGFSRAGDQASRAHNIDTAAARLDGVVLQPHELFSFNDLVGPRTLENGFSPGWEIFKGEMVQGIGGGTCQVASTLHAAAFLAGLDILERLPHSRPSAYITMGLDATVVYPVVDLKLRNPYEFPVVVHSWVDGGTVIFSLLGRERPAQVTFGREVLSTRPFTRKVEEMPGLAANRIIRKQHGIRGYRILRTRTIAYRDGTAHRESNVDIYPPTLEMYLVAPGTDVDAVLPPLPEEPEAADGAPAADPTPPAGTIVASCTADCPPDRPKIVEGPGVHAPRAAQLRAPVRVVIGSSSPH